MDVILSHFVSLCDIKRINIISEKKIRVQEGEHLNQ